MTRTCPKLIAACLRLLLAPLIVLALGHGALAQDAAGTTAVDELFAELRVASDAEKAHQIDQRIWTYWLTPSDPDLAARMGDVLDARAVGDLQTAVTLLDRLVVDYPAYAEGWNQRATMYYMMGNLDASLADCAKVLELEPRHFGALSGRALIYLHMGKRALALKDISAALAIHPFLSERRLFPELDDPATHI